MTLVLDVFSIMKGVQDNTVRKIHHQTGLYILYTLQE